MPRPKTRHDLPSRKPRKFRPADPTAKFIRPVNIPSETGLSLSTVLRLEAMGEFPARLTLSRNSTGWNRVDIEAWQQSRQSRSAS